MAQNATPELLSLYLYLIPKVGGKVRLCSESQAFYTRELSEITYVDINSVPTVGSLVRPLPKGVDCAGRCGGLS